MRTILITGAANGLGAAFVEAYRQQEDVNIIAIDRQAATIQFDDVRHIVLDITSEEDIKLHVDQLRRLPIDLVVHSAGIRGLVPAVEAKQPDNVAACETIDVMDTVTLERTFRINAVGTFTLLRALLPNLRLAKSPKVIIMSSRMGSVGNNQEPNKDAGSAYAYRASKAALNMIIRSLAVDVPEVAFVLCHPGRVETKLVRSKEDGAISAQESLSTILPLIERWGLAESGRYFDRFGETIEW